MVLRGTALSTREPAATMAPLPIVMLPRMVAAAPMSTLSLILGCLSPTSLPVPAGGGQRKPWIWLDLWSSG